MLLSDPRRTIILYYDPERYRTKRSQQNLLREVQNEYPGRHFRPCELRVDALTKLSISPFSLAEAQFLELGHVSEIDCRQVGVGKKNGSVKLVVRNIRVTRTNAMLWRTMLKAEHQSLGLPIGGLADEREEEVDRYPQFSS